MVYLSGKVVNFEKYFNFLKFSFGLLVVSIVIEQFFLVAVCKEKLSHGLVQQA